MTCTISPKKVSQNCIKIFSAVQINKQKWTGSGIAASDEVDFGLECDLYICPVSSMS